MRSFLPFVGGVAFAHCASALALPAQPATRGSYPFSRLVAFGDELSDNGNGSYVHGITGDPADVYSFGTWTNGPVAVQYLAGELGVPLDDYAFGGCCGGGFFGATINNTYTPAQAKWDGKPVPSVHDQIRWNYTHPHPPSSIRDSLQFIWTGQNDLSEHTDAFWQGDPKNTAFAQAMAQKITWHAEYLIRHGAPYVLVANIYPKHRAPVTTTYLCPDGSCVSTWGAIISAANAALEAQLARSSFADKIIYYDVYGYMLELMDEKNSYGLTQSLGDYCDGDPAVAKWDECIAGDYVWEGAERFFWMNFIQPTAHVHRLIARDMKRVVDQHLG